MTRAPLAAALAACLLLPSACQEADSESSTSRALGWLWAQQNEEGLLASDVYGVLRRGESLTAAALLATASLAAHERAPFAPALERAFAALHRTMSLRATDGPVDYPCYTAADHLHALARLQPPGWRAVADARLAQLRRWQLGAANGWAADDRAFGGFGLGDATPEKPRGAELATLSMTTAVLEALRAAGVPADDPVLVDARTFVERCQALGSEGGDGGFCGTPDGGFLGGKGGRDASGHPHSYGTATADGLRALLACGHEPGSPRVRAARAWLEQHTASTAPGLLPEFEQSLRLYWAAAVAQASLALAPTAPLPALPACRAFVQSRQQPNGSFLGLAGAMKEDDPVVATVLALRTRGMR